jgi:hypothetical protein
MSEKQYDNTNRGVLFKNEDKSDDRDADYRGNINFNGTECWLDAWIQTAKSSGKKFMSLRVKPKQASEVKGSAKNPPTKTAEPDFDDDLSDDPF